MMKNGVLIVPCGKCHEEVSKDKDCVICLIATTLRKEVSHQIDIFANFFLKKQCVTYSANKEVAFSNDTINQEVLIQFLSTSKTVAIASMELANFKITIRSEKYLDQKYDLMFIIDVKE